MIGNTELERLAATYGPDPSVLEGDDYGDLLVEAFQLAGGDIEDDDAWQAAQNVAAAYPEPTNLVDLVGRFAYLLAARRGEC